MTRVRGASLWSLSAAVVAVVVAGTAVVATRGHAGESVQVKGVRVVQAGGASNTNNGCGKGNGGPSQTKDCSNPAKALSVDEALSGPLYPNQTAKLFITVTNPNSQAVKITSLSAQITSVDVVAGAPSGCDITSTNIQVQPWTGPSFTVNAYSTKSSDPAYVPVFMPNTVSEACQGATFHLTYSAQGSQA